MNKKKVVILIPTHRPNLIETDIISLAHLKKHLGKYDICFVIPKKINGDTFKSLGYRIKKVNNNFFGTLRRVNESLLNKEFYENFKDYEYLLLYQLDAIILSNQLEMWLKSGYDFIAGTASASAITVSGADYHAFECAYSGAGGVTNDFDGGLVAGGNDHDAITIAGIINPSPESDHVVGASDDQTIIVQHFDSAFAVQDTTTVAVGEIEAVKVTATIDPSISFTIAAVNSAVSSCGVDTDVTTTTSSVPFGTLSLSAFIDASQTLTVSTNAANGYAVTAKENDQLGLAGAACTGDNTGSNCIRDTAGDTTTMTHIVTDEWVSTSTKGFAYSIDNDDASL